MERVEGEGLQDLPALEQVVSGPAFAIPRAVDRLGEGEGEGLQDLPANEKVVACPANFWVERVEGEGVQELGL
jgi:hypothetical protein